MKNISNKIKIIKIFQKYFLTFLKTETLLLTFMVKLKSLKLIQRKGIVLYVSLKNYRVVKVFV